jgi:AcrR family transcriptional regulator
MASRAEQAGQTRARIVAAAMDLQAEQGTHASWEEIARRAEVSTVTVYRHFRSLGELVPACLETIWTREQLEPTPERARGIFADLKRRDERFERLVRASCDCYAKAPAWLAMTRAERAGVPEMREATARQQEALRRLVRAALGDAEVDRRVERILRALVDFPFWQSLVDAGMSARQAADTVVEMVRSELRRHGIAGQA